MENYDTVKIVQQNKHTVVQLMLLCIFDVPVECMKFIRYVAAFDICNAPQLFTGNMFSLADYSAHV